MAEEVEGVGDKGQDSKEAIEALRDRDGDIMLLLFNLRLLLVDIADGR